MANGVTLDTVSFNIESNASSAYKTINSLSTSLRGLKDATAGGFKNLSTLSTSLETLSKSAASLSGVGKNLESIEGIVTQLGELQKVQSPKGLNSTINTLKKLKDETTDVGSALNNLTYISEVVPHINELSKIKTPTGLGYVNRALAELTNVAKDGAIGNIVNQLQKLPDAVEPLKALATIENPRGFNNAASSIAKLVDTFSKLNDPSVFENLTRVSNTLADALTPLAGKMQQIGQGFSALQSLADKYGVSVTKIRERTKSSVSMFTRLGRALNTVGSAFKSVKKNTIDTTLKAIGKTTSSLYSKFKQLTLSLLGTRTLFTLTRKAVSEYMNMDVALSNQLDNLWRALGAQLAPAIEFVMYLFQQLVRVVYSVVKVLFGVDLIARANSKAMGSYADSTKKAVKELGNLAKFDDLNTIDFGNNNSSGSGSGVPQIDLKEIDLTPIQKIVDWMIKFKKAIEEALDTGKWYNVGKVLAEGFNEAVDFILAKIPKIREALFTVARDFGDFLNGVIETLDWGDIGELITESLVLLPDTFNELFKKIHWKELGKGFNELLKEFDPVRIVNSIGTAFKTFTKGISNSLLELDFADIGTKLGNTLIAIFTNIDEVLNTIPWEKLGEKVHDAIVHIDWKGLITSIGKLIIDVFTNLGTFIATALFGKKFISKTKALWVGIGSVLGGIFVKNLTTSLLSGMGSLIGNLGKLGNLGGSLNTIANTGKASNSLNFTVPNVKTVLTGLADLALIVGGVTVFLATYHELTKEPGFQQAISGGLDTLVKVFEGIGKVIIPIGVLSGIVAGIGTLGFKTALSGFAGLALVIGGVPAVVAAVGLLLGNKYVQPLVAGGIDVIVNVFKGLSSVVIPIAAFSALLVGLGFATPEIIGAGALGFIAVIGTLGLVVAALGRLAQVEGFTTIINDGGEMFMKLGEILGGFAGSIVKGFVGKSFEGLGKIADSLCDFVERIQPFFNKAKSLDKNTAEAVEYLAKSVLIFTASGILENIAPWLTGDVSGKIASFGEQLAAFGPNFAKFADSVKDVDGKVVEAAAAAAESVAKFAKEIPNNGGVLAYLIGDNMLSIFGLELKSFGPCFAKYAEAVKDIDTKVVKASSSAAQSLTAFAKEVPNQGGYLSLLIGAKSLSLFGVELKIFGGLFKTYYESIKDIKSSVVRNSAAAAESLTKFAQEVPKQGGWLSVITGNKSLSLFGAQLAIFGPLFKKYYTNVNGISTNNLDRVTLSLSKLVYQYTLIHDRGLANTVSEFGRAIKNSANDIKYFFNNALPNNRGWEIGNNFGSGIAQGIIYAIKHARYPTIKLSSDTKETVAKFKMSALATGTNIIPQDGPYYLHQGESVVPKKYNPAIGGGTNEETNEKLDTLIDIMNNMSFTNVVNIGNETVYKKQQEYNKKQYNKYGTINLY